MLKAVDVKRLSRHTKIMKVIIFLMGLLTLSAAAPVLAAQVIQADESADFPPIEKILGEAVVDMPVSEMDDLRDSLNDGPSDSWIREALRSDDVERRMEIVRAMGQLNVKAVPYLSAVLLNAKETTEVRVAAASSLGRIRASLSFKYLEIASRDSSREVRFASLLAMSRFKNEGVVTLLERSLRRDPSWWVRYAAVIGLGNTKKTFVVDALEQAAREDSQWQVRMEATRALGEIGTPRAVTALAVSLGDTDSAVRAVATQALSGLRGRQGLDYLTAALRKEDEAFLKTMMTKAIRKLAVAPVKKTALARNLPVLILDDQALRLASRR